MAFQRDRHDLCVWDYARDTCSACNGKGRATHGGVCGTCNGTGTISHEVKVTGEDDEEDDQPSVMIKGSGSKSKMRNPEVSRAHSISVKKMTVAEMQLEENGISKFTSTPEYAELIARRPRKRGDCEGGPRPCPWVSCSHHLYLEISLETGSIKINFPGREIDELPATCALDVADAGEHTLEQVGELNNLTRERVRQLEVRGLMKLRAMKRDIKP